MFSSLLIAAVTCCGGGVSRNINVWYPGETVDLRMVDKNICSNGQYDLTVTDWREQRVLTRAYNPKDGGRVMLSEAEVGSFGAFRVEVTERGTTNAPVMKTWFARLRSKNVEPVRWIGTCAHMQRRQSYCDGRFIDMLVAAGVGLVRDDYCWHVCENPRGVYKPWMPFDNWFCALEKRGIGMVVILSLWCVPDCYADEKDLSGFPGFCADVADRFRGRNCVFEIYNEPQNSALRRKVYAEEEKRTGPWTCWLVPMMEAAKKAAKSIHETDPNAKVYMFGEDVGDLLTRMIESDAATANEGISFHPYAEVPERQKYWFADGGAKIRALALKHGGATRFCGTEAGMPTILSKDFHHNEIAGNNFRSSYARQAAVITRFYLLTRLTGMDFLCQYNWMDEGDDPKYTEHNFGQLFKDATPKPSFAATATLARILGKADVVGEKSPEPEKWRMGEFAREDKDVTIYACWSVEGEIKVDWPFALEGAKFLDLMGNEIPAPKTEDGKLRLDDSPVYAVCGRK